MRSFLAITLLITLSLVLKMAVAQSAEVKTKISGRVCTVVKGGLTFTGGPRSEAVRLFENLKVISVFLETSDFTPAATIVSTTTASAKSSTGGQDLYATG